MKLLQFPAGGKWKLFYLALALFLLTAAVRIGVTTAYVQKYDRPESISRFLDTSQPRQHAMVKGDAGKYYLEAHSIIEQVHSGRSFFVAGDRYFGPFLYQRLIALYGLATGKIQLNADGSIPPGQIYGFLVLQSLFFSACLVAFFLALKTVASTRIATISGLFLALEPTLVQWSARLMTEIVFVSLLMLAVAVFIFALKAKPSDSPFKVWWLFLLLGLSLGLMYLQRPGSSGWVLLFLAALFVHYTWRRFLPFLKASALVIAPFVLVLVLLGVHNQARAGYFGVINYQGQLTLYGWLGAQVMAEVTGTDFAPTAKKLREDGFLEAQRRGIIPTDKPELTEQESNRLHKFYGDKAIEIVREHPWTTLRLVVSRAVMSVHLNPTAVYRHFSSIYKTEDPERQEEQDASVSGDWPIKLANSALVLPLAALGWLFARKTLPASINVLFTLSIIYSPLLAAGVVAISDPKYTMPNLVFYPVYWALGLMLVVRFWPTWGKLPVRIRRPG